MTVGDEATNARAREAARAHDSRDYWRRNLRLSALLLLIWFVVSFGVAWFARDLRTVFFGWPLSFWVAAQGAILVYLLIVAVYARRMARLDREHGLGEDD